MNNYAAFLRAINVGGNKVIRMEELRRIFESLKFKNVRTYIQSGNVLFDSDEEDTDKLRNKIEKRISSTLGFEVTTPVRSREEIDSIIKENPFIKEKLSKDLVLYISLLTGVPEKRAAEKLYSISGENEKYIIIRDNVYCLIKKNIKTLFSNNLLEKKLEIEATTRNMSTIQKIDELLKEA